MSSSKVDHAEPSRLRGTMSNGIPVHRNGSSGPASPREPGTVAGADGIRWEPNFSPILALFLFSWPFVLLLGWWRTWLGALYPVSMIAGAVLYLRVVVTSVSVKLTPTRSYPRRDFQGQVDHRDLARLQMYCGLDGDDLTPRQMRDFAISVLAPQIIRRRVTDEYTPGKRTLRKTVTIELDIADRFVLPLNAAVPSHGEHDGSGWASATEAFIALTMPRKGQMYDDFAIHNAAGATLPHLSQREYRLLAAKTLRALLRAAFGGLTLLPQAALEAEELALREIIKFVPVDRRPAPPSTGDDGRTGLLPTDRKHALNALRALEAEGAKEEFITLAVQFVAQLSERYAIVVVLPADRPRLVVRYVQTLVPGLDRPANWYSIRGVRDRLRIFLGARPVFLTVDARNAVTCDTYHLSIKTPVDLYLGAYDISPIASLTDVPDGGARIEPYWRVGGRRGQNYFHLYTRGLRTDDPRKLSVSAKFFEVPPGSLAPAVAAAAANFLVVFAIGCLVSLASDIDAQISAFLLAVPGLAAAWLGFEFKPSELLEGTLVARLSSFATFSISLLASIALLFHASHRWSVRPVSIFVFGQADLTWTVLTTAAAIHVLALIAIYWLRTQYYRRLGVKPVADSAIMLAD